MATTRKLEGILAAKYIDQLRLESTTYNKSIKIFKIHGGQYQTISIPDYIGSYGGIFLAIEFKVFPEKIKGGQRDFLLDLARSGAVAIGLTFIENWKSSISPLGLLNRAIVEADLMRDIIEQQYGYKGTKLVNVS